MRLAILGMSVYLVYTLYQPQADRLIREVKEQVFTTTEAPEALLTAEKEGQQEKQEAETEEAADFPERYDSRDYGKAPDVRNQGSLGTCWAVASVSALEASLLPEEHLRFSADHLSLQNGYAKSQDDGGAYTMTMAYLTSWKGPVLAEDDPYGDGYSPEGLSPVKHVQEIRILKDSTSIKEAVQAYGAVQTSLYMDVQKDYKMCIRDMKEVEQVFVHYVIFQYVAHLVAATREHPMLDLGISPRGTIALTRMAKASAYIKGRNYVVPTDVSDVFKEVAVHRLQLSAKARVNHVTAEGIISTILESVAQPLPEKRQG